VTLAPGGWERCGVSHLSSRSSRSTDRAHPGDAVGLLLALERGLLQQNRYHGREEFEALRRGGDGTRRFGCLAAPQRLYTDIVTRPVHRTARSGISCW